MTGFLLPPTPLAPDNGLVSPGDMVTCPSPHHPLICMSAGSCLPLFSWPHIPHCWRVADGSQCSLDWSAEREGSVEGASTRRAGSGHTALPRLSLSSTLYHGHSAVGACLVKCGQCDVNYLAGSIHFAV